MLGKWASGRTGDPISPSEAGTNVCCPVLPRGRGTQCRWDPVAGTSQVVAGRWGCSVQTGPGGRNLPSGGGVSRRSAPGGSEERLSDHLRRGDSEASWGRWAGSRAWGVWGRRLEVLRSLDPSSPAPPAGGEPEPIREAPAEGGPCAPRSGEPPSLSGPLPRCSCREASLPSLSFRVPSLPPHPSVSSSHQLAESRIHSWTTDGGKASPGAPMGWGQLRAPPAVLPPDVGAGLEGWACACSRSWPPVPPSPGPAHRTRAGRPECGQRIGATLSSPRAGSLRFPPDSPCPPSKWQNRAVTASEVTKRQVSYAGRWEAT